MQEREDEVDAASRRLEEIRSRQLEAAQKTRLLEAQAAALSTRSGQLLEGERALRGGPSGQLPDAAVRSFAADVAPKRLVRAAADDDALMERDAEAMMARRKQQVAEQRVRQEREAHALNQQRLELQQQTERLQAQRAALRRKQALALAATAPAPRRGGGGGGEGGADEVVEDLGDFESGYASGPASPVRLETVDGAGYEAEREGDDAAAAEEVEEVEEALDDATFEVETAAAMRARLATTYAAQEAALSERERRFKEALAEGAHQAGPQPYAGELGPSSYSSSQLGRSAKALGSNRASGGWGRPRGGELPRWVSLWA